MADLLTWEIYFTAASGVLLALLGLGLLARRPHRNYASFFAAFLLLWGVFIVIGNAQRLALNEGDAALARRLLAVFVALGIALYLPLAYFVSLYPTRHGLFATRDVGAVLLVLPGALMAVAYAWAPSLFIRGGVTGFPEAQTLPGPLLPLISVLIFGAFYYAVLDLASWYGRAGSDLDRRRALSIELAFFLYLAYATVDTAVFYGGLLLSGDTRAGSTWQIAVFAILGLGGIACLAVAGRAIRSRGRLSASEVRLAVASLLVPGLFGLLSGYTKLPGALLPRIDTLGIWRTLSAVLIAYAILRYELFDIEVRIKRSVIVGSCLGGTALGALVVEQVLERVTGSVGVAVLAAVFGAVGALAFGAFRLPGAGPWISSRVLPALDSPARLEGRRLEVYEAALRQAKEQGVLATEAPLLVELRSRLGISVAEHALLSRLVRSSSMPRDAAPRIDAGSKVQGRYLLKESLGEGAFGRAFLAQDETLDREVVVKVLHARRTLGEDSVRRFLVEARTAAKLDHPNVVRVFDYGTVGEIPYYVMEYVPGGTLATRILERGALPPEEVLALADGVLSGLLHVHERGIVHGDLKPGNVFLAADGTPKIGDFGLARESTIEETPTGLAEPDLPAGTPAYASPEAVRGVPLSPESDVYSMGALLFHLVTGEIYLSVENGDIAEIRRAILRSPPRASPVPLPAGLEAVMLRALQKDPDRRYRSAEEMRDALRRAGTPLAAAPGKERHGAGPDVPPYGTRPP
ncbi:MAG: protein kinase domain-containing protein [Methanobacteriota archaeon]